MLECVYNMQHCFGVSDCRSYVRNTDAISLSRQPVEQVSADLIGKCANFQFMHLLSPIFLNHIAGFEITRHTLDWSYKITFLIETSCLINLPLLSLPKERKHALIWL